MTAQPKSRLTPEDYLQLERNAERKSEEARSPDETLRIASVECELALAEVYEKVPLEAAA